jgi:triosephosphate isomerase
MRKNIVAGNWKMNKTLGEGLALVSEIVAGSPETLKADVIIAPPFMHLTDACALTFETEGIYVAAQNCSEHVSGAYTGETSAEMVSSSGAEYVIIGHSERREYFNETNEQLAQKVERALENGLTPIFCCGESLEIRESNKHFEYVCNQLTESLFHLSEADYAKIVIAYEPIWAIGTGKTASSEQAQEMHEKLRAHLASKFGAAADSTSILYGGSCKPSNAEEIFAKTDVDGGLIGGASLNAADFLAIVSSF